MTTELRTLRPEDWESWYGTIIRAFGGVPEEPEEEARWRRLIEFERALATVDGPDIVGTTATFSFRLTVPGGAAVPAGGLSVVSVAATHRRQGVLTGMMRRQLDDVRAAGEPLAVLLASEPPIYGRFGYGMATQQVKATIDTARVRLAVPPEADGVRLRWADPAESLQRCEALYARLVPGRPGMIARASDEWARDRIADPPGDRKGASPLFCVLAERDGELVGYARYSVTPQWDEAGPHGTVGLRDLDALDPGAGAALWRFLAGIDLTSQIETGGRPVDDPWLHLVSDPRRCATRLKDQLYLRPVEVGAALAARTYAAPVDVVLDVTDAFCPWNTGRWRLAGDGAGAVCERTGAPADLALTVRELGGAYLGGVRLSALAGAGRVRELRPGALAAASAAFGSDLAPWVPHSF
ncbi:GNAT family N-acetyltransferase [Streptomyces sp. TRM 70351]|uniref:GNAT family N-acetyltransferase n=1 Tax=Streptomyces sp. TRM 70351 TaxID=3116552 RepID=UPI002E7C54D9|nr:GNAT family N-acetyltransferase [Streptomyces sp. TRM 70351]MEE1928381.1 GNAT family N-acetyltransferase [Streptomyces sp. TRM 70351]